MDLKKEVEKLTNEGYEIAYAQARVFQDIVLAGIAKGGLNRNVTIKGGVVMRNLSNSTRRATRDIDLDFIQLSISDSSINEFIEQIQNVMGVTMSIDGKIEELKQKDYKGKRAHVNLVGKKGYTIRGKIDIGVHKDLDIEQEEGYFDICLQDGGVTLLRNAKEQMVVEKLISFLRMGAGSSRYKDVFDIWFLIGEGLDAEKLKTRIQKYIYGNQLLNVNNAEVLAKRIERSFRNPKFVQKINRAQANWTDVNTEEVLEKDIEFVKSLKDIR